IKDAETKIDNYMDITKSYIKNCCSQANIFLNHVFTRTLLLVANLKTHTTKSRGLVQQCIETPLNMLFLLGGKPAILNQLLPILYRLGATHNFAPLQDEIPSTSNSNPNPLTTAEVYSYSVSIVRSFIIYGVNQNPNTQE